RGISAATVMGQLRSTVRAYARLDLSPAQTIKLLDRVVRDIGEDEIVTCVFGIYDPAQRSLTYANAGHPPPLLVGADGRVTRLSGPTGPPLGSGAPSTSEDNIELPDASMLALYTDGLVERRGQDIDDGIDMLARALALVPGSFIELPENIVTTLRPPGQDDDDIALLLVRPIPSDP
ncbi:MAG: PP2C family protein-serine/threonine phosphatase, partial [Acidimicrobiales bacterium]